VCVCACVCVCVCVCDKKVVDGFQHHCLAAGSQVEGITGGGDYWRRLLEEITGGDYWRRLLEE